MPSNVGKWDSWYRDLSLGEDAPLYGDATTYLMAAAFFADVKEVEDWGCGRGGFRRFCLSERYIGVDGSKTPYAEKVVDLCTYKSTAEGILLRHVLEHNNEWARILSGALISFQRKLCIILFTPFAAETKQINYTPGLDVPDISFKQSDIEQHFSEVSWKLLKGIKTETQYGIEHVYLVWR
jgi:hypothetical protein